MNQRSIFITGIILGGLGVVIGAFGAHALKDILTSTGRGETFELAVRYQFYHAFAVIIAGLLLNQYNSKHIRQAALSFTAGVVFFSGSLYVLSLTGKTFFGAITPIGGLFFIIGWALLLAGVYKK